MATIQGPFTAPVMRCLVLRGGWSGGVLLLWVLAAIVAVTGLWRVWRGRKQGTGADDTRRDAVRYAGRLAVLAAALITLGLYAHSGAAQFTPWPSARYLYGLLVAIPLALAVLWPEQAAVARWPLFRESVQRISIGRALRGVVLAFVAAVFLAGTIKALGQIPAAIQSDNEQQALIAKLEALHATRIYSEYWTCDRIIYASQERIICSVLGDDLSPGFDRYLPYRTIVQADPSAAYAFPVGAPQIAAFAQKERHSDTAYKRVVFDGYVVFLPEQ